jgi:uncharacterized coiled-coil DUF342 family protein
MDYSKYISNKISNLDDVISDLKKELLEAQGKVKEIKNEIENCNEQLIKLASDKEDFINFQKGKQNG